ncbi:MAG: asparagine synthetase B [Alphaproteobacteria bacterium]|nr:asparagine synthetase B [Alphaproteobacteria bacterium]MBV9372794.1 asparagine synthetase B [Alphaproteobacteria bacterium]MBV9900511.1 asparagine synthetase B [Alphaproteobacteria bacterium]
MSAIAGYWARSSPFQAEAACRRLLALQRAYGPDDVSLAADGPYAAGRCLFRMLAEDRFDRQPERSPDGRFTLVADLRLDNRDELLAALGLGSGDGAGLGDAALLLLAWRRWGEGTLDRLLGDFAFALWDRRERTIALARDPLGERPLHYRDTGEGFAFASMPRPLALLGGKAEADTARLAEFVSDLPPAGDRSFFADVRKVEPGRIVTVTRSGRAVRRYWRPPVESAGRWDGADRGETLRAELDAAVARRLRRAGGAVGAHLSGGYDSSAVATSAALALAGRGERLLAFTAAPRRGFAGPVLAGYAADESAVAAATAALHPNVDHVVVRPEPGASPLALLAGAHRLAGQPTGHVVNGGWWAAIGEEAARRGVRVMLTGEAGNFTLSAGLGLDDLPDLLRSLRFGRWWREARALASGRYRWRNVVNASLRPWLPTPLHEALRRLAGAAPPTPELGFLAPARRDGMARAMAERGWAAAMGADGKRRRALMLDMVDPGNYRKRALAQWGIEERDATADRRLVEFCFSLPVEARLSDGALRPALRAALAGRVAPAVIDPPLRGYQSADWHERLGAAEVQAFAEAVAARAGGEVIDVAAVRDAARRWPSEAFHDRAVIELYAMKLLRVLAAAEFMAGIAEAADV